MDPSLEKGSPREDEVLNLHGSKLADLENMVALQAEEIQNLKEKLREKSCQLSLQEMENESLHRQMERSGLECELLLQKLDSVSKSAQVHEENEKILREELQALREQNKSFRDSVMESNKARDDVIKKLKDVSLETRELIDNCEKATEETKLFRFQTEEMEEELSALKQRNESLQNENRSLQLELETRTMEVLSLQRKLSLFNAETGVCLTDLWRNDVLVANSELQDIEQRIKTIINSLNRSESDKRKLKEEVEHLKFDNICLQNQNVLKDEIISKQNLDFLKVKTMVDDYHSEILRLDGELKDCHQRVSTLNENLETINSENLDLAEFAHFKRLMVKFGSRETLEDLFSKLQVLHEIEQFFEKNLSPHVEPFCRDTESNDVSVTSKQDAINKIKSYLEKAFSVIKNLNDKMVRLRAEYESKLRTKSVEVSALREVLSNATLYNKILEQTIQQYKDNALLDKTIDNETDELLIVNETLLDGFDTVKHLYRISQRSVSFLYAKSEQLKLFHNLLKILIRKWCHCNSDALLEHEKELHQKAEQLLFLMGEIFEEIMKNEAGIQRMLDTQHLIDKCDKNLMTKDYLKNTVENMSLEVKVLTNKVEQEISEKIREIEELKMEMENMKTDNRELVNKIKNCNREIISLSTENYDLSEKLDGLTDIESQYENLRKELECLKERMSANDSSSEQSNVYFRWPVTKQSLHDAGQLCLTLKTENVNLKQSMMTFSREFSAMLLKSREQLQRIVENRTDRNRIIVELQETCSDIGIRQDNLKDFVFQFQQTVLNDISHLREAFNDQQNNMPCMKHLEHDLPFLRTTCNDLRKRNEELKANVVYSSRAAINMLPQLHTVLEKLITDLNSVIEEHVNYKKNVTTAATDILQVSRTISRSLKSFKCLFEELVVQLTSSLQAVLNEVQAAVLHTFDSMKLSFALSNEEMIREMQEMNLELKTRGETISDLTQSLNDAEKSKNNLLERLSEKETAILELMDRVTNQEKSFQDGDKLLESVKKELELTKENNANELKLKTMQIESLSAELETVKNHIHSKDECIMSSKSEVAKQRELNDGDVSSVGTISKTEEVSRLNDVEESFEERYTKLRVIAIKMKKNISDLNQQLKIEKAEKIALQNKLNVITEQAKRSQALQDECDKVTDELEIRFGEIKELKKIIRESDEINENLKTQCTEMSKKLQVSEDMIATLQEDKIELEKKLKTLAAEVEKMQQEKSAEEILKKEKEREIQQLKQKLKENENEKRKVQNDLEQAKVEVRKQGVLSLEMRDYEKTISVLNKKVEEKDTAINELSQKLSSLTDCNASLTAQLKQLDDKVATYVISSKASDEQILTLHKSLNECERDLEERNQHLKQTIQKLETEKSKLENLTIQFANMTCEMKSREESFYQKEVILIEQVKSLQLKCSTLEECLTKKESELNQIKDDFEAYKVRARSVLQKRKTEHHTKNNEEKLQSEIDALGQTIKELRKRLDDSLIEMDNQKAELKFTIETKEKLQKKVKEFSEVAAEKTEELESIRAEQKTHKLNTDTLVNCLKMEIEKLKSQIKELELEKEKMLSTRRINPPSENLIVRKNSETSCYSENGIAYNVPGESPDSELEIIDEAKNYGHARKHSLVPLDKLLETSGMENGSVPDGNDHNQHVEALEEQVKYLTRLLNESEKNSARNEQQVALFKEEIRRLQRMFEREPHLQNTEYLKNVVLKFVTLPLGDEKSRLVNVIETILKLTPNEKEMLSAIAKGCRPDQKHAGGWTSFWGWS